MYQLIVLVALFLMRSNLFQPNTTNEFSRSPLPTNPLTLSNLLMQFETSSTVGILGLRRRMGLFNIFFLSMSMLIVIRSSVIFSADRQQNSAQHSRVGRSQPMNKFCCRWRRLSSCLGKRSPYFSPPAILLQHVLNVATRRIWGERK